MDLPGISELRERALDRETLWSVGVLVAATAGGMIARRVLKHGWERAFNAPAPLDPTIEDVQWWEAVLWGVLTGATVGLVRVLSRRGAVAARQRWIAGRV